MLLAVLAFIDGREFDSIRILTHTPEVETDIAGTDDKSRSGQSEKELHLQDSFWPKIGRLDVEYILGSI
ncbi:MAG: hypothetical protein JWN90_565 [Parcubacteria group bacterium]|nr:hypothetical protein [Parcubacteria group bacterium]